MDIQNIKSALGSRIGIIVACLITLSASGMVAYDRLSPDRICQREEYAKLVSSTYRDVPERASYAAAYICEHK